MTLEPSVEQSSLQKHVDVFVNNFFVNGARNYIRKTTLDAPWINLGITEKTNTEGFYSSKLFSGMNVFGGNAYSLGHGLIHGYLDGSAEAQVKRAINNLNALGTDEIIFYHDESIRGLNQAVEMGLEFKFKPVSLLEWLIREIKTKAGQVQQLNINAAVQLPCSWKSGDGKNVQIDELFDLIGVKRVQRKYDYKSRICCGSRGYFGLISGNTAADSERAEAQVNRNVADAVKAGAEYMVTTCPFCFAATAATAKEAGLIPVQIESLASLALYNETLPDGQIII